VLAVVVGAVCVMGCGTTSMPDPGRAARAFADAIERSDAEAVHAMLDADTRASLSVEALATLLRANRRDLASVTMALRRDTSAVPARAHIDLGRGDEVILVTEEGGFHIDGGAAALVTLATPEQAVQALRSALLRGDLEAFLRVLSSDARTGVETELARILEETADALDIEVGETGDEAVVRLTGGRLLHLVREDGEWHVVDLP
jgi:hypothetical protein